MTAPFFYATTHKVPLNGTGLQYDLSQDRTSLLEECVFQVEPLSPSENFTTFTNLRRLIVPIGSKLLVVFKSAENQGVHGTLSFSYFIGNFYPDLWPDNTGEPGGYIVMTNGHAYRVAPRNFPLVKVIPPEAVGLEPFPLWEKDATHKDEVYAS